MWENGTFNRRPYMGKKCKGAHLVEKEGFHYQIGGPAKSKTSGKFRQTACGNGRIFAMPFEVSFAINFTVVDGLPRGCGILDGDWRFNQSSPTGDETGLKNKIFIGNMFRVINLNNQNSSSFLQDPLALWKDQPTVDLTHTLQKEKLWLTLLPCLLMTMKFGKQLSLMLGKRCKQMDMNLMN